MKINFIKQILFIAVTAFITTFPFPVIAIEVLYCGVITVTTWIKIGFFIFLLWMGA